MFSKDECEYNPAAIKANVERHWGIPTLNTLKIEVLGSKDTLGFVIGIDQETGNPKSGIGFVDSPHITRNWHDLNEDGRRWFSALRPQFGKVWIQIPGEAEPMEYPTYEEFLSAITG